MCWHGNAMHANLLLSVGFGAPSALAAVFQRSFWRGLPSTFNLAIGIIEQLTYEIAQENKEQDVHP